MANVLLRAIFSQPLLIGQGFNRLKLSNIVRRFRLVITSYSIHYTKLYDTTVASVTTTDDRVAGDLLTISDTANFDDKNVGTGKAVSVSGATLSGTDAGNYVLASSTGTTTADITARTLTVNYSGVDRVYDGTTDA